MSTLAEFMILSGANNRSPMLEKHLTKKNEELFATKKIQADCDLKATNIILQGLTSDERECKLYDAFDKFAHIKEESLHQYYLRFTQLINDMNIYKMKLEQFQVNTKFLNSLPPEWNPLALVANHQITPSHFNTYQSSYNNPQFQQQFSPSQSPQYGSIHPTQHYSTTYPSIPHAITSLSTPHPNAYSSIVHQDACPQPQSIPQIKYTVFIINQQTHRAKFPQIDSGLAVLVFKQGDDPIDAINKMMSFLRQSSFAAGTSGTRANISGIGKGTLHGLGIKFFLVEAQRSGKVLNEEELEFLADPRVTEGPVTQMVVTHNASYQVNDLDAYDSDCDDFSTAKAVLMAIVSSYGSDVLSEDTNSSAQKDAMILSVFEQLSNQVTNYNKVNKDNLIANESLSAKLERYKEWVKLLEERQNMDLRKGIVNESNEKEAKNIDKEIDLEKKVKELDNIVCKMGQSTQTRAQQIRPTLYDGRVISKETNVISIADSEETLMLKEESRSKMLLKQSDPKVLEKKVNIKPINYAELNRLSEDFGKRFVSKQDLSDEQAFWLQTLHTNTDQTASSPVKIEAPLEIHKISLNNTSVNQTELLFDQLFELNNLKAELQAKDTTIEKLKANIKRLNKTSTTNNVKKEIDEIETINLELEHKHSKLNTNSELMCVKCNSSMFDARHELWFLEFVSDMNASSKSKSIKKAKKKEEWKPTGTMFTKIGYNWRPTGRTFTLVGNAYLPFN
nr:hypothetical protein [Tanacetum cinerariifolium]